MQTITSVFPPVGNITMEKTVRKLSLFLAEVINDATHALDETQIIFTLWAQIQWTTALL